ncbi:LysR family transcriptional regulator [Alteromonas confluentis]|uniref:LysR family transcriptional regulator n=1 Tax=Alteromonas confluentis TaxID=1656094 RepID=A0A1E7Z853_9ALTE|nr:LysR family transcriptional regulator [Alteromonas confluentis]OFC69696.1 LysR family transcriptional regulator [Alteromonas confluentis]
MKFDLTDLRLLVAIADNGNLTKGAETVFLAPSSASHRIKLLERNLGAQLLIREARGVKLTKAGEIVLRHGKKALATLEQMQSEIFPYTESVQTHIKLWANTNAIHTYLPDDLAEFLEQYPNVKLILEEHSSEEIAAAVASGEIEIGIVAEQDLNIDVLLYPYKTDRLVMIVPKHHALSEFSRIRFEQAVDFPFVILNQGSAIHTFTMNKAALINKHLNIRAQVKSFDAVCRMVASNVGIALVPHDSVTGHADLGIHILEVDEVWSKRDLKLCVQKHTEPSRLSALLLTHLLK